MNTPSVSHGKYVTMTTPRTAAYSKENYRTDTVTILGDDSVTETLPEGTPMAQLNAGANSGLWVKYDSAGADGADVCKGLLANNVRPRALARTKADGTLEATNAVASVYFKGEFDNAAVTALGFDATALSQLNGSITGNVLKF